MNNTKIPRDRDKKCMYRTKEFNISTRANGVLSKSAVKSKFSSSYCVFFFYTHV